MAGGAGGTGEGISTASLAWSIIMASFAAFGGILFGSVSATSSCLCCILIFSADMTQERLEVLLPWKTGLPPSEPSPPNLSLVQ